MIDALQSRVRSTLLDQFYEGVGRLYLMHSIGLVVLAAVFYLELGRLSIIAGCVALQLMWYLRYVAAKAYQRDSDRHLRVAKWERYSVYSVVVSAAAYSLYFQSLFDPDDLRLSIPLTILYLGVLVAGALSHTPGVGYLAAITIVTTVGTLVLSGDEICRNMAVAVVLISMVCRSVGKATQKTKFTSLSEQYINAQLADELAEQVDRATQAEQRANSLNAEKSRFISAASHDLRQPLHAVSLHLTALRRAMEGTPGRVQFDRLDQSVDALNASFNEMLDLSRLDANLMNVELQAVPISACFAEVQASFVERANAKGVLLRFRHSAATISADPVLLVRLIGNLVDNAIKFTSTGGVLVAIRSRKTDKYPWIVEVRDSGPGIPIEHQATIFEEYFQLANEQRDRREGSGLGLAVVKRLVGLMDMEIDVISKPGCGATFRLHCKSADPIIGGTDEKQKLKSDGHLAEDALCGKQILVVDNEAEILSAMEVLLTQYGAEVLTSLTAENARETIKAMPGVSLAVVDFRLGGGIDGLHLALQLRDLSATRQLPILVMTGDTSASVMSALHGAGLPVCFKPLKGDELIKRILLCT